MPTTAWTKCGGWDEWAGGLEDHYPYRRQNGKGFLATFARLSQAAAPQYDAEHRPFRLRWSNSKGAELKKVVANLLTGPRASDHVVALTDVYTGTQPPDFRDATDAKSKMRGWVGAEPRFHPHAAQYDFEAWLLPYWPTIQRLADHKKTAPAGLPETVNHMKPAGQRIEEIFEIGGNRHSYVKPRDAESHPKGERSCRVYQTVL